MKLISLFFSFAAVAVLSIAASAQTFSNANPITIRDNTTASLYPSTINVSGVNGTVSKVTVTLTGVSHTYPEDIGVLLVGPTGVKVRLWTDAGGGNGGAGGGGIAGVNVTFDDSAANFLPDGTAGTPPITTGSYKPTMGTSGTGQGAAHPANFPSPAPASPYTLTLSSFNGVNPTGNWSLFVDDDDVGDSGAISGGWSLTITAGGGGTPVARATLFDFTGNGITDFTVFTNSFTTAGVPLRWNIAANPAAPGANQAFIRAFDYGLVGDSVVPNDYRGDLKVDVTVRRPSDRNYYVAQFPTGVGGIVLDAAIPFGAPTDAAGAEGDYDGDGKDDYTVVRVNADNSLTYFMRFSVTNTFRAVPFGSVSASVNTQLLRGADFTGDGRDEIVFAQFSATPGGVRPVTYFVGDAVSGAVVLITNWGDFTTDNSISPADYTGDRRADLVAVRETTSPAIWYIRNTATGASTATPFGIGDPNFVNFDYPVRGDYDGDGRHDVAVWRPSNQTFYFIRSGNNLVGQQKWGFASTDIPLAVFGTF